MTQKYIVRLSIDERKILFQLLKEGNASKEKQNRARILLKADFGSEVRGKAFLEEEVKAWTKARNEKKVVANWQFTTADARVKLRKLYQTI